MTSEQPRHIGLLRLSALGDIITMVPLVRTLESVYPNTTISWFVGKSVYTLLKQLMPAASRVKLIPIAKPARLADYKALIRQLRTQQFDIFLATHASLRVNILYPAIKAKRKIAFDRARASDGQHYLRYESIATTQDHYVDMYLRFAEALGVDQAQFISDWRWSVPVCQMNWARELLRKQPGEGRWLLVNPSASTVWKTWSADRYIALINQATQRWGYRVILTGGPSSQEMALAEQIANGIKGVYCNLVGKTDLLQLAALLKTAEIVVAPDTGPLHLAVAVGTPVIGLYAATRPECSGPYGQLKYCVNRFPEAAKRFLQKDTSTLPYSCRIKHPDVMKLITVEHVLEKMCEQLKTKEQPLCESSLQI